MANVFPTKTEFTAAIAAYRQHETRGPIYFLALDRISKGWGEGSAMADGIGLLLESWHNVFYRFGPYDPESLRACIEENMEVLTGLRQRTIQSFGAEDEPVVRRLFVDFTIALKGGKNRKQESPVATAKALHLLAPTLLPLWDNAIASAYGQSAMSAHNYIAFCSQMWRMAEALEAYLPNPDDRPVLKRLDEFNYAAYTQGWVRLAST